MGLLEWVAPVTVARFEDVQVRAASLGDRVCRAIGVALKDCGASRDEIAGRMSEYLGTRVSKSMLDAYASQAREDHSISVVRFVALMQATGDRRLLELLAETMGWSVVERRVLRMIELNAVREGEEELRRRRKQLQRECVRDGIIG